MTTRHRVTLEKAADLIRAVAASLPDSDAVADTHDSHQSEWVTVARAAKLTGLSRQRIYQRVQEGAVPVRRHPDLPLRVRVADLLLEKPADS